MMKTIFADAETYYAKDYTLRQMTPIEYILDPRWETIGWAVAEERHGKSFWLEGDEFKSYLQRLPVEECRVVSHNALFDMTILAFRYGLHPKLCVDTMSMARALLTHKLPQGRVNLANVAKYLGKGEKGTAIHNVQGYHLEEMKAAGLYDSFVKYGLNDVDMTREIYYELAPQFPAQEFLINHMIIEMTTRPQFAVDTESLMGHLAQLIISKESLLDRVGVSRDELMSNDKFALALQRLGVDPPKKTSVATGKLTWAFARTDEAMIGLSEHDNPEVQSLVAARFGYKSTLEETRTQRFIKIAEVTWDGNNSWMPIPLRYSGAHTHRLSGDWKLNLQNLPSRKSTLLRESLIAPEGHDVLTCDAAQIEARLTAWICKQTNLLEQFENGEDVYSLFASDVYGVEVTRADKPKRLGGKICILGLGFGMGSPKFQDTWRVQSADAGMPMTLEDEEARRIVNLYRSKFVRIKNTWYWLNDKISGIASGAAEGETFGPCTFVKGGILLPSGLELFYEDLKYIDGEWEFTFGGKRKRLYGGKMLENIIQALDRICVMDAAIRFRQWCKAERIHLPLAHQVHDELIYIPQKEITAFVRPVLEAEMATRPWWGPDLPLAAETGVGPNYGKAK
jgi:DNA polymerase